MAPAEGTAEGQADGHHRKHDVRAQVHPEVIAHPTLDCLGEGEDAHYAEGDQQLQGHHAEHLRSVKGKSSAYFNRPTSGGWPSNTKHANTSGHLT